MLSKTQEKRIRLLHTKKGREKAGRCIVEGAKVIETAGKAVELTFSEADSPVFNELVSTQTPQNLAAVALIPHWTEQDLRTRSTVIVLDGVQDPGNVGAVLRLCLGFDASLVLVESVDVTSPKVVRSSVGAMFQVPWVRVNRRQADSVLHTLIRDNYEPFRLEISPDTQPLSNIRTPAKALVVAGAEGIGITLKLTAPSISIAHDTQLESLNVGHAVAIALHQRYGFI